MSRVEETREGGEMNMLIRIETEKRGMPSGWNTDRESMKVTSLSKWVKTQEPLSKKRKII